MKPITCLVLILAISKRASAYSYIGERITGVSLKISSDLNCGGKDLSIEVCAQDPCCTIAIGNVSRGITHLETVLQRNCRHVRVAGSSIKPRVKVFTADTNQFCPEKVEVGSNFDKYEANFEGQRTRESSSMITTHIFSFDDSNDSNSNGDPGMNCPSSTSGCPIDRIRMRGYKQEAKNQVCEFLCDSVTTLSSNSSSVSGYFCSPTRFERPQPQWCCLNGRVNDIPDCSEVGQSTAASNTNNARCPQPSNGNPTCPTDRMKMFGFKRDHQPLACQFLCDHVTSLSLNSPSSGYACTATAIPVAQPNWCCLDGEVNDIPSCAP